ncbi:pyrimidine 5'-nucleotidase [Asticcacaulis sp. AND118]|uniref:pyrimidine 5'-nucleotidase n=1 Tax=Asticcacaulis sp. AND118 TaxID=2840468 RepID=UPI001CFF56A8|nr:pyrimidine 5'-nucleotidase [Asticcacaulis sp. AND118]UDF02890.1 pyrimidine 5'-nucleotidase [Asticcacaulis sp. AND118]
MSPHVQNLPHVSTWLFDLDNTLYPPEAEVMALVEGRMTDFVMRQTGLPREEARTLQKKYLYEHGTTLAGLMAYHNIEPYAFMNEVHDVSLDGLIPDLALNDAITALPGRKLVFTNGDEKHAYRILDKLEMTPLFEDVFHLGHADLIPKPNLVTFHRMMQKHAVTGPETAFFEDSPKNLKPAHQLGMTTILVGPHAAANADDFVHIRAASLKAFLEN